jgi:type IX secretion system PorP/SprF family membrane protein
LGQKIYISEQWVRRKYFFPLLLLLCIAELSFSQSEPMYSQYMFNTLPLNPAYAGSHENLNVTAVYRKQWLDMDGAPSTQTLSAHSPIKNKNIALGFSAIHDKIGVTSKTGFYGVYAYRINFKNKSKLSLGVQGGVVHMVSRLSQLQTKQLNDPHMSADRTVFTAPGVGAGAFWYSDKYYIGASVPDLWELKLKQSDEAIHYRHVFLHAGYVFKLSYQVKYMPGFLIKDVKGSDPQFDFNNILILNDVLWLGISYRHKISLNFLVQAQLTNQLQLGYSYDAPMSDFSSLAGSSHELKLSYKFVFFKDNAFMPRYF